MRRDAFENFSLVAETQAGIQDFIRKAGEGLCEVALASSKALGDSPEYAVRRWSEVLENHALDLLREKRASVKMISQSSEELKPCP